uniref:Snake toxin/toxin-like domain-containing protein n=1 Tax=Caenorhabditis japonica TaxID=281687 RepID=A0A8R1DL60_CAEJA
MANSHVQRNMVNCDDCCEEDLCNSNFSVQYYEVLMSRQYTSWTTPLPGEVEFNRKHNIRFPYSSPSTHYSSLAFIIIIIILISFL